MGRLFILAVTSGSLWSLLAFNLVSREPSHHIGAFLLAGVITGLIITIFVAAWFDHKFSVKRLFLCALCSYYLAIIIFFLIAIPLGFLFGGNIALVSRQVVESTLIQIYYALMYGTLWYGWSLIPLSVGNCLLVKAVLDRMPGSSK